VLAGCGLRASFLAREPLWVDEAESAINSLTILDHGYPADHYLGMPIYENTLLRPWPESEEYEFADISYSRRGLAIYHGWLPLYSIAGALALGGITPDRPAEKPAALHSVAEFTRRTVVPRLPSLAFSALFLLALYGLGRELQGHELGLAVLCAGALCEPMVWFGWQARYYSATLAFSAAAALGMLRLRRGGLGNAAALGLVLALLFHSHALSCLILTGLLACWLPTGWRDPRLLAKLAVVGGILAAGTLPWMVATGFLGGASEIPKAWTMLVLPQDLFTYPLKFPAVSAVIGLGLAAGVLGICGRLPRRLEEPFARARATITFAGPWLLGAFLAFTFLIPAPSHFSRRLSLVLVIPGLLLVAVTLSEAVRLWRGKAQPALTALAMGVLFLVMGKVPGLSGLSYGTADVKELVALVAGWDLRPGTKLYATPNDHLVLSYYTGLPFQSVAPVRRSFLDSYPGDVIILEGQTRYVRLSVGRVQAIAASLGTVVDPESAEQRSRRSAEVAVRRAIEAQVGEMTPPLPALDRLDEALVEQVVSVTREQLSRDWRRQPMMRAFAGDNVSYWGPFFYRFVGVESRLGAEHNYRRRISRGRALVLPQGLVIYDCRRPGAPPLLPDDGRGSRG
jgi:4-amino-4-deoxy-L-arabinose transferase-like glycosyltransferase